MVDEAGAAALSRAVVRASAGRRAFPWAAEHGAHIVTRRPIPAVRAITDAYRAEWRKLGRSEADLPLMGVNRHIVVADTDGEARDIARRAYPAWRHHMGLLVARI